MCSGGRLDTFSYLHDDRRAEGQVGHKVAVHNVYVQPAYVQLEQANIWSAAHMASVGAEWGEWGGRRGVVALPVCAMADCVFASLPEGAKVGGQDGGRYDGRWRHGGGVIAAERGELTIEMVGEGLAKRVETDGRERGRYAVVSSLWAAVAGIQGA